MKRRKIEPEDIFPVGRIGEFWDRKEELENVIWHVKAGQNLVISAPRRMGKTTLILEALRRIRHEGNFLTCYVDLFLVSTKREFAEKLITAVLETKKMQGLIQKAKKSIAEFLKSVKVGTKIDDWEVVIELAQNSGDDDELCTKAVEFPERFAHRTGKKIVVAVDEFGEIKRISKRGDEDSLLKKMRAVIQRQKRTVWIFSGSKETIMREIFSERSSAFFRFGKFMEIGYLDEEECVERITEKLKKLGLGSREDAEEIVKITRGHPYDTLLLAQELVRLRMRSREARVKDALMSALESERGTYLVMWDNLRELRHSGEVLKAMAKTGNPYKARLRPQIVRRTLKELEKSGVVKRKNRGEYTILEPLFEEFLRTI